MELIECRHRRLGRSCEICALEEDLSELRDQIESMKCCGNCKNYKFSELLDAIYWLCDAVTESRDVFFKTITFEGSADDAINHLIQRYPIIQGTRNQINLRRLGDRAPKLIKSGGIFEKLLSELEPKDAEKEKTS